MIVGNQHWVALVDAHHARLLCCGLTSEGGCHVEEYDSIENTWPGHEHHRPSPLRGKTGESCATGGKSAGEELTRFAKQVAEWLERKIVQPDRIVVFAPPRFLGALRRVQSDRLAQCLDERRGELMHFPTWDLGEHPAIRELLGLDHATEPQ